MLSQASFLLCNGHHGWVRGLFALNRFRILTKKNEAVLAIHQPETFLVSILFIHTNCICVPTFIQNLILYDSNRLWSRCLLCSLFAVSQFFELLL